MEYIISQVNREDELTVIHRPRMNSGRHTLIQMTRSDDNHVNAEWRQQQLRLCIFLLSETSKFTNLSLPWIFKYIR